MPELTSKSVNQQLIAASQAISAGGVIAYPAEACFGLGCHPKNSQAVKRILQLKHRPSIKGLIVIGADLAQLKPYIGAIPQVWLDKMQASWPAAITYLVPAASWLPRWLIGNSSKIAVRVPAHAVARELCRRCRHPLVSTSANKSGQPFCRSADQVKKVFAGGLDYLFDHPIGKAKAASMIIDVETDEIHRS